MSQKKEDIKKLEAYKFFEGSRGREFVLRLLDGSDLVLAIKKFCKDQNIRIAKIHAAFEGSFQPAKIEVWTPDTKDPTNWHNISIATFQNIGQICALGGIIHPRIREGKEDTVIKIHGIIGGGWDVLPFGGHLREGTIVKGVLHVFITELLGMDELLK